jgi:hypothetical protein
MRGDADQIKCATMRYQQHQAREHARIIVHMCSMRVAENLRSSWCGCWRKNNNMPRAEK